MGDVVEIYGYWGGDPVRQLSWGVRLPKESIVRVERDGAVRRIVMRSGVVWGVTNDRDVDMLDALELPT